MISTNVEYKHLGLDMEVGLPRHRAFFLIPIK
jgi:hypothetical protein